MRNNNALRRPSFLAGAAAASIALLVLSGCGASADNDGNEAESSDSPTVTETDHSDHSEGTVATESSAPTQSDADVTVTVEGGEVSPAPDEYSFAVGDEITISVTSDVDDEVHVHGYDNHLDLTAGEPAELTFTADIPGAFEVELEDAGLLLFEFKVE